MENKTVISIETVIGYITQNIICIVYLLKQSG